MLDKELLLYYLVQNSILFAKIQMSSIDQLILFIGIRRMLIM